MKNLPTPTTKKKKKHKKQKKKEERSITSGDIKKEGHWLFLPDKWIC